MKPIKQITVHPYLGNETRTEVLEWCRTIFNDEFAESEEEYRWVITSNYERSYEGTFDVLFKDIKDAEWFILRWGGDIVSIEYEDVPEQYFVEDNLYKSLFE